MEKMQFAADLPYPEIKIAGHDVAFAKKLLFAYTGRVSEMTAVTGYCYRRVTLEKADPALSEIMSGIARVEMLHLNILARLIFLLGYDPKYRTTENEVAHFWNADILSYKKNVTAVLKAAIEEETEAYNGYTALSRESRDPNVRKILTRLAADEKLHIHILTTELEKRTKKPR